MDFKVGKKYKSKCLQRGKSTGMVVAHTDQILTCVSDGHMKRLAYWTRSGMEVSWHVSQYDRKNFVVSK